jgi:hypothetical protein
VNPGASPIEIAESKLYDVPGAKTQPCEQEQNRPITPATRCGEIARRDNALHLLCLQIPWERGQTPVRQHGDRAFQSGRALTFRNEEAKEHAKGGRALFRSGPPTGLTTVDDKLSKALCIERVGVAAETADQLNNVNAVIG